MDYLSLIERLSELIASHLQPRCASVMMCGSEKHRKEHALLPQWKVSHICHWVSRFLCQRWVIGLSPNIVFVSFIPKSCLQTLAFECCYLIQGQCLVNAKKGLFFIEPFKMTVLCNRFIREVGAPNSLPVGYLTKSNLTQNQIRANPNFYPTSTAYLQRFCIQGMPKNIVAIWFNSFGFFWPVEAEKLAYLALLA